MNKIKLTLNIIASIVILVIAVGILSINSGGEKSGISPRQSSNVKDLTYDVGGVIFNLKNGKAEIVDKVSSTTDKLMMFGEPVYGDLNNDGVKDAAVLLANDPGGSGTFYYAALAINNGGSYKATGSMLLGDRIAPQTVEIRDGRAVYNFAERRADEPMSVPPSIGKSVWVHYDAANNQIGEWVKGFEGEVR